MRGTIFTAGFLGLLGAASALAEDASMNATADPDKAEALEAGIASAFEHRFMGSPNSTGSKREHLIEDISTVARANLNQKEIAALQAAFAKGIKPLPEDNESTKTKSAAPECCQFPSQS